jgi:hypothetical protein
VVFELAVFVLVGVEAVLLTAVLALAVLLFAALLPLAGAVVPPHPKAKMTDKMTIPNPKNRREKLLFIVFFIFFQNVDAVVSKESFRILRKC